MKKGDTIFFEHPPTITAYAAIAGKKEGEGPLREEFDETHADTTFGEKTWEKAEAALQLRTVEKLLSKAGRTPSEIDYIFCGDLENQITASAYTQRELGMPYLGLYGACSTMAEGLGLSACFVSGGMAQRAIAATSSHFCAAERIYRMPLVYGGKRTPTAQWTVTGAGACLVEPPSAPPFIKAVTFGRVADLGVKDANNMGAAMAPAAAQTIAAYFKDSGTKPEDYDAVYTGDLGAVGSACLEELLKREYGIKMPNHQDCGLLIFDRAAQNVQAGASGCGCSASVLCAHILPRVKSGKLKNILFVATGALLSTITVQQKESIPGVAHLLHISHEA